MKRMLSLFFVFIVAIPARAQQALPPAAPGYYVPVPPQNLVLADDLEDRGRHKKRVGVALMSVGGALILIGQGLLWFGLSQGSSCTTPAIQPTHTTCITRGENYLWGGLVTTFGGLGLLGAGIPVFVIGNRQVKKANALRGTLITSSLGGIRASLQLSF